MSPRTVPVTISVTDVPEVRSLIEAVIDLPPRWSDGCGECCWCRLDAAIIALARIAPTPTSTPEGES